MFGALYQGTMFNRALLHALSNVVLSKGLGIGGLIAYVETLPPRANRRSFDSGAQNRRASAQDDNSNTVTG